MAQGGQGSPHPDIALWRQYVRHWFPRLHERAYFVPPVYMNRVHYETVQLAGLNVDIPQPPVVDLPRGAKPALQMSHVRDDQAQQRILHCLHKLAETQGEPMVVISQLQFGDYLNNPCYAAAASMLPRPIDLKQQGKHRGDFDLLLIHRHYGIVVGEIKTVGDNFNKLVLTEQEQDDLVAKKVQQAVKQLNRADDVMAHLVSDLQHPPRVLKTMMLPNITRCQLQRVLDNYPQVRQDLCQCLGVEQHADPIDLCLYAEHLPDRNTPWDVTDVVLRRLSQWWSTAVAGPHVSSTEDDYVDMVARFTGPATTVQIFCVTQPPLHFRSQGEGVAETSRRFTRDIVLTPRQLVILNRNLPLVILCGPPGTGKTVMLELRARDWLYLGYHVHVLSLYRESLAVSHLIVHKLQQDAGDAGQRVHLHVFDFGKGKDEMETAVKGLLTAASQGPLCVVVDEVPYSPSNRYFASFCTELCQRIPELRLWAASLYHDITPPCLTEVPMTEPLRTPPVITRHVQQSDTIQLHKTVRDYTVSPAPPPCDGPAPRVLYHAGPGHSEGSSLDCVECGENVASVLRELYDSVGDPPVTTTSATTENFGTITGQDLQYRDTIILCDTPRDDLPVVSRLRAYGLPVQVVTSDDDEAAICDVALASRDVVIVTDWKVVSGLERTIVVVFGSKYGNDVDRLLQMSRSTSLLIWVPFRIRLDSLQKALSSWLRHASHWYPGYHERTYFIPPLQLEDASRSSRVKTHDPLERRSFLLRSLKQLGEEQSRGEGMMIISRLDFRGPLGLDDSVVGVSAANLLVGSFSPLTQETDDFHLLIIHSTHGLIIGEVKFAHAASDTELKEKIQRAAKDLEKNEQVIQGLVSILPYAVNITKTIILPDISPQRLRNTLATSSDTFKDLVCHCLGAFNTEDCAELCLSLDLTLVPPGDPKSVARELQRWWKRMSLAPPVKLSDDDRRRQYELLLVRFCGPAAHLDMPTATAATRIQKHGDTDVAETCGRIDQRPQYSGHSQAAGGETQTAPDEDSDTTSKSDTGGGESEKDNAAKGDESMSHSAEQNQTPHPTAGSEGEDGSLQTPTTVANPQRKMNMASLVLSPTQIELFAEPPRQVFLTGPPGTGKSSTLQVVGKIWYRGGNDVHILSLYQKSRAMSILLEEQLKEAVVADSTTPQVAGRPKIIRHEFYLDEDPDRDDAVDELEKIRKNTGKLHVIIDEAGPEYCDWFRYFIEDLVEKVEDVHLWASAVEKHHRPGCLPEVTLDFPHRCPREVLREVQKARAFYDDKVHNYSYTDASLASSGEKNDVIVLRHHLEEGHKEEYPRDCERCGDNIADELKKLNVNKPGHAQYRDVLILCIYRDEDPDDVAMVTALRRHFGEDHVQVVKYGAPYDILRDVALADSNKVTVAHFLMVSGLERRIVVGMGVKGRVTYSKLIVTSRCSSQLIWIDPDDDDDDDDDDGGGDDDDDDDSNTVPAKSER